ncbi:NAD(+) diphosphatase [Rhodosalinus halophilus]|uniref:NAD(+) diphosphatase n=1 Tax=Rhodosalinus halophilus TaxID=2259333 RepID=A0A365UAX2_9RHOB|nr:NAD(+) diphosphatase [Rhodosalinus halophilus]RBI86299.1 NAD(+) diphosphatase [Rhodosalinus halophilus]
MRLAETVTFGGSALDRADALRGDPAALAQVQADARARALALWRGKPLFAGDMRDRLARLPLTHPALAEAEPPLLLGCEDGAPVFASDLSAWEPAEGAPETLGAFLDPSEQRHPAMPADHVFGELRARMVALSPRDAELAATARALLGWHRTHRFCARCGAQSTPERAGWVRRCPACGACHFPRTDPVVIMLVTRGERVLLGRSPGWPERMFSLLAGFVEPGETVEAAVRREVAEEAGIAVGRVGYLASQPWPFPASLMLGCHGEALSDAITLDPAELEDAVWVGRSEMLEVFAGAHPRIRAPRPGAIASFLLRHWVADRLA